MIRVTLTDRWTGLHGFEVSWVGRRLDAGLTFGFGESVRWTWRRARSAA